MTTSKSFQTQSAEIIKSSLEITEANCLLVSLRQLVLSIQQYTGIVIKPSESLFSIDYFKKGYWKNLSNMSKSFIKHLRAINVLTFSERLWETLIINLIALKQYFTISHEWQQKGITHS